MVALEVVQGEVRIFALQLCEVFLKTLPAIDVRLACAEQIEVWAVDDDYFHFQVFRSKRRLSIDMSVEMSAVSTSLKAGMGGGNSPK